LAIRLATTAWVVLNPSKTYTDTPGSSEEGQVNTSPGWYCQVRLEAVQPAGGKLRAGGTTAVTGGWQGNQGVLLPSPESLFSSPRNPYRAC
jgi:hypothetical protein